MSKPRNITGKGGFTTKGSEPLAKRSVSVRLPQSIDLELKEIVGDNLTEWLRKTIIENLEIEKAKLMA